MILAAGLVVRLVVAPLGAHPGDFATLTGWANALGTHSLLDIYRVTDANYPPLTMALLAASRWAYGLAAPGDPSGPLWMILLKLPPILADLGICWLVWKISDKHGSPVWVLAAIVFNPALIYLSAWWGQYESVTMLAALAATRDALDGRLLRAGLWLGAGLMVKLQAATIMPVILIAALRASPRLIRAARLLGGLAVPLLICLGPYAVDGQIEWVMLRLVALVSSPNWLTINALNLWYLLTGGAGNWRYNAPLTMPDDALILPGLSAHSLGLFLLAGWTAAVVWALLCGGRKGSASDGVRMFLAAALLCLGAFFWPTQAHERYAFGAVVFLAGASAQCGQLNGKPAWTFAAYGLVTLLHMLNLMWAAPFGPPIDLWCAGDQLVGVGIALGFASAAVWILAMLGPPRLTRFCRA